ncbi:hypothetical protein [Beijerinckia sp. L45]|uniref:hypothetical protein n=1 Tax=Beijerinckia sp. L45 TaxID=1641855 RepID=UPI00131E782A|nr:hypothetical protein [Beijerinckia sp. L45]
MDAIIERPRAKDLNRLKWQKRVEESGVVKAMDLINDIAEAIASGRVRDAHILTGVRGIGKTRAFKEALGRHKRVPLVIKQATTLGLLQNLQEAARNKQIALLDDADSAWDSLEKIHALMVACQPEKEGRRIYAYSVNNKTTHYCFDGLTLVMLSNINLKDTANVPKKCREAIKALTSRVPPINLALTHQDVYEYTVYLAICREMLKVEAFTLEESNDALAFFSANRWRMDDISVRKLLHIARVRRKYADKDWQFRLKMELDDPVAGATHDSDDEIPQIVI